jgi:hypothetical protein
MALCGLDEADVALDGIQPTPSMRTGAPPWPAIAPSATKYDADEASPSTWMAPGVR